MTGKQWYEIPELSDREWLLQQKFQGKSNQEIGEQIGASGRTVETACKHHGITLPLVRVNDPALAEQLRLQK